MLTIDWLQQKMIQSSLLLGFAVAILVALIALRDQRRRTTLTIVVFTFASFMLLIDNYSVIRLLTQIYSVPQPVTTEFMEKLSALYLNIKWVGTLGFLLLILGIGCTGWIHSKLTGALSTAGAVIAVTYVFGFAAAMLALGGG
jgi:hypothetical protein